MNKFAFKQLLMGVLRTVGPFLPAAVGVGGLSASIPVLVNSIEKKDDNNQFIEYVLNEVEQNETFINTRDNDIRLIRENGMHLSDEMVESSIQYCYSQDYVIDYAAKGLTEFHNQYIQAKEENENLAIKIKGSGCGIAISILCEFLEFTLWWAGVIAESLEDAEINFAHAKSSLIDEKNAKKEAKAEGAMQRI